MKQLTVHSPEAWAIVSGIRSVDNRSRIWKYRGPVIIHSSLRIDIDNSWLFHQLPIVKKHTKQMGDWKTSQHLRLGVGIGIADLVDCLPVAEYRDSEWYDKEQDVFVGNKVVLVFRNAIRFREPFDMKGKLGLCDADPEYIRLAKLASKDCVDFKHFY